MSNVNQKNQKVAKYLRERLDRLFGCNTEIRNKLEEEKRDALDSQIDDDEIENHLSYIERVVELTFRYSMLIAVCSFLEEALKLICQINIGGYQTKLKAIRNGNWLTKHRQLLRENTSVSLSSADKHWNKMEDFVMIRNCIAHSWGNVDECKKKERIQEIVKKVPYFEISKDGYLGVTEDAVPEAIWACGEVTRQLGKELLDDPH